MRRLLAVLPWLGLGLLVAGCIGMAVYAIVLNHQNRRDINRIIRPSPEQTRAGIDQAIRRMTAAEAAAIFRKLPPSLREQLRGPRGFRGREGKPGRNGRDGTPGRSGSRGSSGVAGKAGRAGGIGPVGRTGPQGVSRAPNHPRAPAPRPPHVPQLVPNVPAPFPPQGGLLPNGKPCPPQNPNCS